MKCYLCDAEMGDRLGACENCRSSRQQQRVSNQGKYQTQEINNNRKQILIWGGSTILGGIAFILLLWIATRPPIPANISHDDRYLTIASEDKTVQLRYFIKSAATLHGHVYDSLAQAGSISESGIFYQLHFLEPKPYQEFLATFGKTRECPAPFYNAHMQHVMLVSKDTSCPARLKSRTFGIWEEIRLNGHWLEFSDGSSPSGPLIMPGGNYKVFLINSCDPMLEVSPSSEKLMDNKDWW